MEFNMRIMISLLALTLSACASTTPTVYGPADANGHGYTEQRIETDRFRVSFHSGYDMTIEATEDMALLRAAQLTQQHGGTWFVVVHRSRSGNERDPVRMQASAGHHAGSRRSGSSVGLGVVFDGSAGEKSAMVEILVRSGEREIGPDNYSAADVIANNPACGCEIIDTP
jgi:hypothetical protein